MTFTVEWEFPDGSSGSQEFETWEEADTAAMKCNPSCRVWLIDASDPEGGLGYILEPLTEFFR